jgi:flagellar protein FliO/FliZ
MLASLAPAMASATESFAVPQAPALSDTTGGLLRVALSLALVVGAVIASAWLMRRLRGIGSGGHPAIEVLAQASLGTRERAVLVRVGGHELLLGVAAGSVRTLLVLGDSVVTAADASRPAVAGARAAGGHNPSFGTAFKTLLARKLGTRDAKP